MSNIHVMRTYTELEVNAAMALVMLKNNQQVSQIIPVSESKSNILSSNPSPAIASTSNSARQFTVSHQQPGPSNQRIRIQPAATSTPRARIQRTDAQTKRAIMAACHDLIHDYMNRRAEG